MTKRPGEVLRKCCNLAEVARVPLYCVVIKDFFDLRKLLDESVVGS